jgi:flagellar assembly protein FliH
MARIVKAETVHEAAGARGAMLNLNDLAAEANGLVLEARKEAARIVAEARSAAEAVEREAAETGYAEGVARGRSEGWSAGEREARESSSAKFEGEMASLVRLVRKITKELADARSDFVHAAHYGMLDFAVELAEKIVGRVAAADVGAARANLRKALELVDGPGDVTVRVNPAQLYELREHCAKFATALAAGDISVVADDHVAPGGVRLLRSRGEIDATIQTQLDNVVRALLGTAAAEEGRYEPQPAVPQLPFAPSTVRDHEPV